MILIISVVYKIRRIKEWGLYSEKILMNRKCFYRQISIGISHLEDSFH